MSLTKEQDEFITALYKEMFKKLVNIGYELLGNVTLAEEVAQEAFLIACKKPDDVMNSENPQGWMVKTLHNLVKNLKRLESPIADTVKYHLGMVNADVTVVFPHDALELLKMSSLFQKIGDNALSMKIIRAYESCSYMTISMDRHITERNAQPADSLYHWIEIHDTRVIADPTDIDKAITAINVFLRK